VWCDFFGFNFIQCKDYFDVAVHLNSGFDVENINVCGIEVNTSMSVLLMLKTSMLMASR